MADFTFIYPAWLLALLPLALLLPLLKKNDRHSRLLAPHLSHALQLLPEKKAHSPIKIVALSWILAVIALAGPSFNRQEMPAAQLSEARVLVMEMSQALYATDILPSRLEQAKYKALDMLPHWQEGSTALVSYAGDSYTVSPLTQDAKTLQGLISALSPQIMPSPGSNLSAGIAQAITLLNQAGFNYGDIVVISSGATQSQVDKALELLKNKPYRVHVLAIGTEQGAPITLPDGQLLSKNGKVVLAKLNLLPLARLATATKGIVERWQPTDADVARITSVPSYAKQFNENNVKQTISERINHGVWLLPVLLLLALASFRRGVILLLAVCVLQPAPKAVASPSSFGIEKPLEQAQQILTSSWQHLDKLQQNPAFSNSDQKALHAYQAGNFQDAANQFTSPAWKGAALYKAGDYQSAIEILTPLNDTTSAYNLANAHAKTGDYAKAAELYRALLAKEPSHRDAKRNLALVEQALKEQ
ncbi:MAG: VWA domain-containing protein, partial [Enterovibrio sp.]